MGRNGTSARTIKLDLLNDIDYIDDYLDDLKFHIKLRIELYHILYHVEQLLGEFILRLDECAAHNP